MKHVVLIRHGATAGNLQRRYIGRTDEPLCPEGWQQLHPEAMPKADRIIVSPMLRTRQSAQLLFPGRAYTICDGLRETDFGVFEGKTADEMADDPRYRSWVDSGCTAPIPGGESVSAFKRRCRTAFLLAMLDAPEGSTTAFVIHGGCIMAILEAFVRPQQDFYQFALPNGGYIQAQLAADGRTLTILPTAKPNETI